MKHRIRQIITILLTLIMSLCVICLAGCSQKSSEPADTESAPEEASTGDVVVLFTSDVHCGVDQGWGYAGLQQSPAGR